MTRISVPELTRAVVPDWIDMLGHMNVAAYVAAFDLLADVFWFEVLKLQPDPARPSPHACFVLQNKVAYHRELRVGERFRMAFQLLDFSEKYVHFFLTMTHADQGHLVATSEQLALHVEMTARRSSPFPSEQRAVLQAVWDGMADRSWPPGAGEPIKITKGSLVRPIT